MSDDTNLTLPGSIPGLLRRGSPVFWRDEETPFVVTWVGPWPDSDTVEDGAIVLSAPATSPCLGVEDNVVNFAIDLTDATGRAHAAWWLSVKVGLPVGNGTIFRALDLVGWTLQGSEGGLHFFTVDLDPNNPRLLPDGSRWVDAEALRRVVLHVAGLPLT